MEVGVVLVHYVCTVQLIAIAQILLRLADQPWLVAVLEKCAARGLAGEYCAAGAPLCDHGRAHGLAYTLRLYLIGVTEETHSAWKLRFYCCLRVDSGVKNVAKLPCARSSSGSDGSNLVDPASSHTLVSKIKPCMSKYKQFYTVKLRMAHYISYSLFDSPYYLDNRSNSRANTCINTQLLVGRVYLLD